MTNRINEAMKTNYAINKGLIGKSEMSQKNNLQTNTNFWLKDRQKSKLQAIELKNLKKVKGVMRIDRGIKLQSLYTCVN